MSIKISTTLKNLFIIPILLPLFFSCSQKKEPIEKPLPSQHQVVSFFKTHKDSIPDKISDFELRQDSLRNVLINSMPDETLKNSQLAELYIRGLVKVSESKYEVTLPFDLHGLDCGAPDCYEDLITFTLTRKGIFKMPDKIPYQYHLSGCVDEPFDENGIMEKTAEAEKYVRYYLPKHRSTLFILAEDEKETYLYLFESSEKGKMGLNNINSYLEKYDEGDETTYSLVPFTSTLMQRNEYEGFLRSVKPESDR